VHRRRESASLPKKEGITSVGGMSTMANPNDPAENLKWFYEHCASHHYLLETAMPMLDVAVFILHYIKNLDILFVSNQVKADLARSIVNFTKTQCSEKHLLVYVESITLMLLDLMADENFQHDKLSHIRLRKQNHQSSSCHPFKRNLLTPMVVVGLWDTLISMLKLETSLKSQSKLVHLFQ